MDPESQTSGGLPEQLSFCWEGKERVGHGGGSEAVSRAAQQVVGQGSAAEERKRTLEQELMEKVADEANLLEALRRVCANKGSAGVDGMDLTELKAWMSMRTNREIHIGVAFFLRSTPVCPRSAKSTAVLCGHQDLAPCVSTAVIING